MKFFLLAVFLNCLNFSLIHASLIKDSIDNGYEIVFLEENSDSILIRAKYNSNNPNFYRFQSNPRFKDIIITITFQKSTELRITIKEENVTHWELPETSPFPHDEQIRFEDKKNLLFYIRINIKPFGLIIKRKLNNETIFDTTHFNLILSERYLEFSSVLSTDRIFGFGESNKNFQLKIPAVYTIWGRDLPGVIDQEKGGNETYGAHPMYLMAENQGFFHIVYLRNTNGMDILLNEAILPQEKGMKATKTVTYKVDGGIIDLKFFLSKNKSPENLVKDYHEYVGTYTIQPFWSFGFHQSRWGYRGFNDVKKVLDNYLKNEIPLDAVWFDIDYMKNNAVFTVDEMRFNSTEINSLFSSKYKKKLVVIIDPGVKVKKIPIESYKAYDRMIKDGLFIQNSEGKPLKNCVWGGESIFPDFFHPQTEEYWSDLLNDLHNKLNFSGVWLDMNEYSGFVDGQEMSECSSYEQSRRFQPAYKQCKYLNSMEEYVYNLGGSDSPFYLDSKTLCLNARHYGGLLEKDVHTLNSILEVKATYNFMKNRLGISHPFLMSRSTMPGTGKYAIHWSGDNVSSFKWLRISISGILNFNLYGIPNNGADICGFSGDTSEEMCARWFQLGSLYPFSRNHNSLSNVDQDPFAFGPTLLKTSSVSIKFRYSLLKHYYSLFVNNQGKGMVLRPLFFEFPSDSFCYEDQILNEEFLIGKDLLVTPVLYESTTVIRVYFPIENTLNRKFWYDINSGEAYEAGYKHFITNNLNETAPVFLREGKIIFRQDVAGVQSTADLNNEFYLSVALKKASKNVYIARGLIMGCKDYNNDKCIERCLTKNCMIEIKIKINRQANFFNLNLEVIKENPLEYEEIFITRLEFYGLDSENKTTLKNHQKIKKLTLEKKFNLHPGKNLGIKFR